MPSHLFKNYGAYQCTTDAHNFVKVGQRTSNSFVENGKVVMIDVVAKKDIGNEFQECRLLDVRSSHKKDRV